MQQSSQALLVRFLFAAVGLGQGLVLEALFGESGRSPLGHIAYAPATAVTAAAFVFYAAWLGRPWLTAGAAFLAGTLSGLIVWLAALYWSEDDFTDMLGHLLLVSLYLSVIVAVAARSFAETGSLRDGAAWAEGLWQSLVILIHAALFTLAVWLMLAALLVLLDVVGLPTERFVDAFGVILTMTIFGLGAALIREWQQVAQVARGFMSAALLVPLYPFVPLTAVFLAILPFTPADLHDRGLTFAGTTAAFVLGFSVFVAATYQRTAERLRPPLVVLGAMLLQPLLILTLLGIEVLRFYERGPGDDRQLYVVFLVTALGFSLFYLRCALVAETWPAAVIAATRRGFLTALVLSLLLVVPYSFRDVLLAGFYERRILTGETEPSRKLLTELRFDLGDAGVAVLERLAAESTEVLTEEQVERIDLLLAAGTESEMRERESERRRLRSAVDFRERIRLEPSDAKLPPGLIHDTEIGREQGCSRDTCALLEREGTDETEWAFVRVDPKRPDTFLNNRVTVSTYLPNSSDRDADNWTRRSLLNLNVSLATRDALVEALRDGTLDASPEGVRLGETFIALP